MIFSLFHMTTMPINQLIKKVYAHNISKVIIKIALTILIITSIVLIYRFKRHHTPFFYIGIELCVVFILASWKSKRAFLKSLLITLSLITFTFSMSEAYFAGWLSSKVERKGLHVYRYEGTYVTNSKNYWKTNELLGYAGGKNISVTARKYFGDKLIYDITYTNNQYGLRITPHDLNKYPDVKDFTNVVFFGCSFMAGQGVNDDETLPYIFENLSKGSFRAYNFGFHGYGPHQTLRILEAGLLDNVITDKKPVIGVCEILTDHIERTAGKYPYVIWDVNGPKYVLDSSGEPKYVGKFGDEIRLQVIHFLNSLLAKSHTLDQIHLTQNLFHEKRTPADITLFVKVIEKAKNLFVAKYHGHFIVLLWKLPSDRDFDSVLSQLQKCHIDVITTKEILKVDDPQKKYLIDHDGHPNKLANTLIAEYLLANIRKTAGTASSHR